MPDFSHVPNDVLRLFLLTTSSSAFFAFNAVSKCCPVICQDQHFLQGMQLLLSTFDIIDDSEDRQLAGHFLPNGNKHGYVHIWERYPHHEDEEFMIESEHTEHWINNSKEGMQIIHGPPHTILGMYKNNMRHGLETVWYHDDDTLIKVSEMSWYQGKKRGLNRLWTCEGKFIRELLFENDKMSLRPRIPNDVLRLFLLTASSKTFLALSTSKRQYAVVCYERRFSESVQALFSTFDVIDEDDENGDRQLAGYFLPNGRKHGYIRARERYPTLDDDNYFLKGETIEYWTNGSLRSSLELSE